MPDALMSQFDIATYLVPGYVVVLAAIYAKWPDAFKLDQQRLGAGVVLASVMAALLTGVVIHRVSGGILLVSRLAYGEQMLVRIVRRFEHLAAVKANVSKHMSLVPRDDIDAYFYGRILVNERMPRTSAEAERLMSMSLLCRNMLVSIPIAWIAVTWRFSRTKNSGGRDSKAWLLFVFATAVVAVLEFLFAKSFHAYWTASVWRILRAAVLVA